MTARDTTVAQQLAELATGTDHASLPETVRASLPSRVLDLLGVAIGALPLETSRAAIRFAQARGGPGQAHVLGLDLRLPAAAATFANGVLAHSLDFDDTHLPSVLHPSAAVIPAALAAAEAAGATGAEFLHGVAVGLETCTRLGMAGYDPDTRASVYFQRGQHATSICGTVGAAVAASAVHRLSTSEVVHAIGVSASMGAGILEANRNGGTVKRLHCGWAAQAGVSAVELVQAGFTAPASAIEGRFGLLTAFLGDQGRAAAVTDGLGDTWELNQIFFKPYPANNFTHAIVDAAARLHDSDVRLEDVETIEVLVPTDVVRTVGEPLAVKQRPETVYQAQFSAPYAAVLGLLTGTGHTVTLADYSVERATDPVWRAAMARVTVAADLRCDRAFPHHFPAIVRLRLADGTELLEEVLANRGGPEWPLTEAELTAKFLANAARWLDRDAALGLLDRVQALPSAGSVSAVLIASQSTAGSNVDKEATR